MDLRAHDVVVDSIKNLFRRRGHERTPRRVIMMHRLRVILNFVAGKWVLYMPQPRGEQVLMAFPHHRGSCLLYHEVTKSWQSYAVVTVLCHVHAVMAIVCCCYSVLSCTWCHGSCMLLNEWKHESTFGDKRYKLIQDEFQNDTSICLGIRRCAHPSPLRGTLTTT